MNRCLRERRVVPGHDDQSEVGRDQGHQLAVGWEAEGEQASRHTAHLLHLAHAHPAHLGWYSSVGTGQKLLVKSNSPTGSLVKLYVPQHQCFKSTTQNADPDPGSSQTPFGSRSRNFFKNTPNKSSTIVMTNKEQLQNVLCFLKISLLLRFQLKHRFISAHPCNPHPTTQKSNPRQYAFRDLKATIFASY